MSGQMIQVKERPVTHTAIQWTGLNREEMMSFLGVPALTLIAHSEQGDLLKYSASEVDTLTVKPGEWLIYAYDDKGYPSPCYHGVKRWTDRQFRQRYEPVEVRSE